MAFWRSFLFHCLTQILTSGAQTFAWHYECITYLISVLFTSGGLLGVSDQMIRLSNSCNTEQLQSTPFTIRAFFPQCVFLLCYHTLSHSYSENDMSCFFRVKHLLSVNISKRHRSPSRSTSQLEKCCF